MADYSRFDVVVWPSKALLFVVVIVSGAVVAGGLWGDLFGGKEGWPWAIAVGPLGALLGWPGVVLGGLVAVYALARIVLPIPSLAMGREGVLDYASLFGAGFVPWSDVESTYVYSFRGNEMLALRPRSPEQFLARFGPIRRVVLRWNVGRFAGPYCALPAQALTDGVEDLGFVIQARYGVPFER